MMPCLTDCNQSASEVSHQSSQQEFNDQEDRGETKEEARFYFMDFPVRDVAEQLTRLDSVGLRKLHLKASASLLALHHAISASGTLRQSGALSLPGLHLVSARQERKPKPGAHRACNHFPVQRGDQPCHHLPALPIRSRSFNFITCVIAQLLLHLPVPLRWPELTWLCSHQPRPQSTHHREVDLHCSGLESQSGLSNLRNFLYLFPSDIFLWYFIWQFAITDH